MTKPYNPHRIFPDAADREPYPDREFGACGADFFGGETNGIHASELMPIAPMPFTPPPAPVMVSVDDLVRAVRALCASDSGAVDPALLAAFMLDVARS